MSMPLFGRYLLAAAAAGTSGALILSPKMSVFGAGSQDEGPELADHVPSRAQQLSAMRSSTREKPFDVLVIGGGGTGAGCAADAQTRGLKTVLIERDDFGSGTSSRSTKLVHGGVRYLEKAVFQLDYSQLKLVYEALHERDAFLKNAAHLSHPLPILMPCYNWWDVPYFWAGLKAYDFVAGRGNLVQSKYMNTTESLASLPTLATVNPINNKSLKGSILYYDGQFDDSRMAVTLACTAAAAGAVVANHVECKELIKNEEGKIVGARCHDLISNEPVEVYAKVVINATGTLADTVRKQSNPDSKPCVAGSSGTHITLPSYYGSDNMGLIIPKTRDGRVLFMLPWQGTLIAGTTDSPCDVNPKRSPVEDEVTFIIDSLNDILGIKVQRSDVLSAWSGVRPLPSKPDAKETQNVVRDHLIFTDPDGMVSVTGGKWTTYRRMAEEAVDAAIATGRLPMNVGKCRTHTMRLIGAQDYRPTLTAEIAQQFSKLNKPQTAAAPAAPAANSGVAPNPAPSGSAPALDVDSTTAHHLAKSYGDRAPVVLSLAVEKNLGARLHPRHPILEAEVAYCVQNEYCETADDFLQRRTRLAFTDAAAAVAAIPRVVDIMGAQLNWSRDRKLQEQERARATLQKAFFATA